MEHLVGSSQNMVCCFDFLYFPSKHCIGIITSIKHLISVKMHFATANSSTEKLSATLPKDLPSNNLNSLLKSWKTDSSKKKQWEKSDAHDGTTVPPLQDLFCNLIVNNVPYISLLTFHSEQFCLNTISQ